MKNDRLREALLRIIQGVIIGVGAILPGVSGGVMCAAFGLYVPLMNLLANPVREIKKSYRMWIFVSVGCVLGFLVFAGILSAMLEVSENVAMALFAGLIVGTLPALFREAEKESAKFVNVKYFTLCIFFCLSFVMFVLLGLGEETTTSAGFLSFLACGGILGLGFIIPGFTSSSILMHLGLYAPLIDGFSTVDFSVLIPTGIGAVAVVALFAKLMKKLFSAFYAEAFYGVIGIVAASTIFIIPRDFESAAELIMSIIVGLLGAAVSYFADKKLANKKSGIA